MVRSFKFASTPEIIFGNGSFQQLPGLIGRYGSHMLLLTGARSLRESPFFKTFTDNLKKNNFRYEVIGISEEPSPMLIDGLTSKFRRHMPDVVVSIGGGSVIDSGKAMSAMLPDLHSVYEYLEGVGTGKQHPGKKVPFIAVPTTSGTGSETTKNAVLSDVGKTGFKRSIRHDNFVPDIALIDPELTLSCPSNVTAACGMDAFTQLMESYVSLNASPFTDVLAFSGLEAAIRSLIRAYKNHSDLEARTGMSYAALVSGITLANAGLGVVHGFASVIGGYHNVPHGVICGTLLAESTKMNISTLLRKSPDSSALEKYRKIGLLMMENNNGETGDPLDVLVNKLFEWTKELKIPKLGNFDIRERDLPHIIKETGIKQNPAELGNQELETIIRNRY